MIWKNSKMAWLYYSKDAADEHLPCTVKITETEILVEYEHEGLCQYVGKNTGNGHFELRSADGGRATLHQFPGTKFLDGWWIEDDGERGMWRIELDEGDPAET